MECFFHVFCRALLEGESNQWIIWRDQHAGKLTQGKKLVLKNECWIKLNITGKYWVIVFLKILFTVLLQSEY